MTEHLNIAMWSGPRNLSTALMRSFENRADVCAVMDEPFYAAYLVATDKPHPMRADVLASQPQDWRAVAKQCQATHADGMVYQKHMAQHMLSGFGWDWADQLCNVFLIREPERVAASFLAAWPQGQLQDLGFVQQAELFERLADKRGQAPAVVDASAIRRDPETVLRKLCQAIGIDWDERMLNWPPGLRGSDGVWAAHWYKSVEDSTGFAPPETGMPTLNADAQAMAEAARPYYEKLAAHSLS